MHGAETLIERIIRSSQIPSGKRQQDIARELRAHIEDFVHVAQQAGHDEAEIERLVAANFGDPQEIARDFAWVYRRERAILRIAAFLLSTLVAASFVSVTVVALQASMALGLGVPIPRVLGAHHLTFQTLYILCTSACYVGLISLEKVFDSGRFQKAAALSMGIVVVFIAGFVIADAPGVALVLILGFASGMVTRAIQRFFKYRAARIGAVLACFGVAGLVSVFLQPANVQNVVLLKLTVWLTIGMCCHLMTHLAARVDRALLNRIQQT